MPGGATVLARDFAMANFLNPNLDHQLKAPQNIYGRNVRVTYKDSSASI